MRTAEDYRKLVDGYKFSLSLLKEINYEVFGKFMSAKDLLEQKALFSQMVCQLKIDFIQGNDNKDCGEIKLANFGTDCYGLTYIPKDDYTLTLIYEKINLFGGKKYIFELFPQSDLEHQNDTCILVIAKFNSKDEVSNSKEYHAYLVNDMVIVFKRASEKNGIIKNEPFLTIPLEKLKQSQRDFEKMF